MSYRTEHDTMGEVKVPSDKYWGAQKDLAKHYDVPHYTIHNIATGKTYSHVV